MYHIMTIGEGKSYANSLCSIGPTELFNGNTNLRCPQSRMDYFPGQFMSAVLAGTNGMQTSKLSFDGTRSYHKRIRYLTWWSSAAEQVISTMKSNYFLDAKQAAAPLGTTLHCRISSKETSLLHLCQCVLGLFAEKEWCLLSLNKSSTTKKQFMFEIS
jgi:hypothetical protein